MGDHSGAKATNGSAAAGRAVPSQGISALDCRLGSYRCAIPLSAIQRIIDLDVTPLPLSKDWVGGVARAKDELILSVTLHSGARHGALRRTKGVVLVGPAGSSPCALEVDETRTFLDVRPTLRPFSPQLPGWVREASLSDGTPLACVDVGALFAALTAAP